MGKLMVGSDCGVRNRWSVWEMVIDASGFVDWYWRWRRFVILFLSFAGFQRVEVLGKEFDVVSGASSCLAAAAVVDLAVRQDPLTASGNAVG